jgi:hypothetical protein
MNAQILEVAPSRRSVASTTSRPLRLRSAPPLRNVGVLGVTLRLFDRLSNLALAYHSSSVLNSEMSDWGSRGQRAEGRGQRAEAGRGREGGEENLQCARALPFENPPKMYRPPVPGLFLGEGTNVAVWYARGIGGASSWASSGHTHMLGSSPGDLDFRMCTSLTWFRALGSEVLNPQKR